MSTPQRLIRDVCQVTSRMVFLIGICAGLAVSLLTFSARELHCSTLDIEMLIGSTYTSRLDPSTWWIGFGAWLLIAGACAYAYAFIFWSAHRSGAAIGINLGVFNWIVSGLIAGILPAFHPLLTAGDIEGPGFFMISSGFAASFTFFLAHVVYGACVGKIFDWAAMRNEYPRPLSYQHTNNPAYL
jgi:hypothetical protein